MPEESSDQSSRHRVLFLCTGNSCRSQIAEALTNARYTETWQAFSAGTRPAGYIHPKALQVLQEVGIDHQGRSKSMDEFWGQTFDLVVTVCDAAAEECPVWPGAGRKIHAGFPDPAHAAGSDEEILQVFREVRDDIGRNLGEILAVTQ